LFSAFVGDNFLATYDDADAEALQVAFRGLNALLNEKIKALKI
jgi:hypothetical protein